MSYVIPFCQIDQSQSFALNSTIPNSFINKYGSPSVADDNYEYISGGIVNMVQEFSKTILTYFDTEISKNVEEVINYLNNQDENKNFI